MSIPETKATPEEVEFMAAYLRFLQTHAPGHDNEKIAAMTGNVLGQALGRQPHTTYSTLLNHTQLFLENFVKVGGLMIVRQGQQVTSGSVKPTIIV